MGRLDEVIADVAYILDTLMAYRNIQRVARTCNDCGVNKTCKFVPKPGELVRFNCPMWTEESE